ncbi:PRC-barrel domain-containing protein [Rhizobium sp.]|uniref:PRC-barrel domain-containing protein n=1 Tax=Rhizobium sp. TaxID=391 RepID=UPI002896CB7A
MKTIIAAAIALGTMSTAALAQQPAAPATTAPAATAASGADATIVGPGITMGTAATAPLKTVEIKGNDLVTSKLVGLNIYNKENEEVGEISDVVIGDGKSVIGVIASVGGFLGMGASYVVIDPASIALADDNGTWKAYVDTNKDDLSKAPKFDYDKMKK